MMPVAKNLKFADARGMSTVLLSQSGFPVSFVSASAERIEVFLDQVRNAVEYLKSFFNRRDAPFFKCFPCKLNSQVNIFVITVRHLRKHFSCSGINALNRSSTNLADQFATNVVL
jgi:hypothetical protein